MLVETVAPPGGCETTFAAMERVCAPLLGVGAEMDVLAYCAWVMEDGSGTFRPASVLRVKRECRECGSEVRKCTASCSVTRLCRSLIDEAAPEE